MRKPNIKTLAIVIVAALIFITLVFLYRSRVNRIKDLASICFSKAEQAFENGNQQEYMTLLDELITKYPKTSEAYQGKLLKADALTQTKLYDKALDVLEDVKTKAKSKFIKSLALARIIHVYDSKKDYANVIATSKEFINKYPNHFLAQDIYLNLAETYLITNSKDEAIKTFKLVLTNFPTTQEAQRAQKRLNEIDKIIREKSK